MVQIKVEVVDLKKIGNNLAIVMFNQSVSSH